VAKKRTGTPAKPQKELTEREYALLRMKTRATVLGSLEVLFDQALRESGRFVVLPVATMLEQIHKLHQMHYHEFETRYRNGAKDVIP
jgi:hypothetical protein